MQCLAEASARNTVKNVATFGLTPEELLENI
jgi:hypothetical protein